MFFEKILTFAAPIHRRLLARIWGGRQL